MSVLRHTTMLFLPSERNEVSMMERHEDHWEVNATPKIIGALYHDLTWEKAQSEGMTRADVCQYVRARAAATGYAER